MTKSEAFKIVEGFGCEPFYYNDNNSDRFTVLGCDGITLNTVNNLCTALKADPSKVSVITYRGEAGISIEGLGLQETGTNG